MGVGRGDQGSGEDISLRRGCCRGIWRTHGHLTGVQRGDSYMAIKLMSQLPIPPFPSHPIPSHPLLSLSHQPPSALIHYTHKSSPPPSFPLLELTPSLTWYTQQTRPIGGIWLWRRGGGKKERGEGDVVVDRCMCRCRYRYI